MTAPEPSWWRLPLPQPVFRLLATPAGLVAIELRDSAAHQVRFQVAQLGAGPLGLPVAIAEPWLGTLAALTEEDLWLHGFVDPQMPQPAGLYCLSLTGQLRWYAPQGQLLNVLEHQVLVQRRLAEDRFAFHLLNRATGFVVRDLTAREVQALAVLQPDPLQTPVLLPPDDPLYPQVHARLLDRTQQAAEGPIALLQADGVTYASGFSRGQGWLVAIARQALQWRQVLPVGEPLPRVAVAGKWVIWVRENAELAATPHPPA